MATMLNVYDRQTRKKTAVLQNAFNIVETHELNQIYTLSFSLPFTDEKNKYCLPRHFVRWGDDGELYRIKAPKTDEGNVGTITYECEHVITTLCDSVMFGSFNTAQYVPNLTTRTTIEWLLSKQKQQDWVLDVCEFDRKFEYLWEQENILNALYSVPKEFATPYKWTFNTTTYPWKISLRAINTSATPEFYLRARSNILSSGTSADYANICTRIYPLGYGEGVNQLNIKDVNNGVPYIQSPQNIVNQYGIVEKVLVDRRFENAESLKAYAQSMLDVYQTPTMSRTFDVTDLYPLTNYDWNNAEVGKICKMTQDGTVAYITRTQRQHDKAGDLHIDLSTKPTDIAASMADLADRVRIESVYAQGATQLYQHSKDANATPEKGMVMNLYFPSEMRQINKVLLRLKLEKFRSYSQTADYGGAVDKETGKAGNINMNTGENGAINQNTGENGAINQNTGENGAINQNTGENGAINQNTGENGAINQNTGENGAINQNTGENGGFNTETGSGGGGEGQTSEAGIGTNTIDIDAATGTTWDNTTNYTYTDSTSNGSVEVAGSGEVHYGETYATVSGIDGYHTHDYYGGTGEKAIDGGYHHHYVSVNVPYKNKEVINNDPSTSSDYGRKHIHTIGLNGFTHSHSIKLSGIGSHSHSFYIGDHSHSISVGNHSHSISVGNHSHSISVGKHSHSISVENHSHSINVAAHSHTISIPAHQHNIIAGIFESGNPTAFDIYVGGKKKTTVNATSYNGDIVTWLLNSDNEVPRNQWIDIEIRPNDLAYVVSSVFVQGFVQSRGGGNY